MKIKKSQLKHIIKEEIKRIVNEQGIRQPGEPMTTSIGHELRMDRDEPLEAPAVGGGAGFEEMRRQAGLSGAEGEEVRTDAPEGYELPEEEKDKVEQEQPVYGAADIHEPEGGYAYMGGGNPNWNITRQGDVSRWEGDPYGSVGPPLARTDESRQQKLQRIIEEELYAILSERDLGRAYDIVEPDLPGAPMKGPKEPVEEVPPVVPGSSGRGAIRIPGLEAHIASLPEVDPEEEPELIQRYGGEVPMGERGASMVRQQRPHDYYFGN
jgi:hypothetical protein